MLHIFKTDDDDINMLSTKNINFENVQNMLSNSNYKLSENAEKCKKFLENYMSTKNTLKNPGPPNMQMLLSLVNSNIEKKNLASLKNTINADIENKNCDIMSNSSCDTESSQSNNIKEYIDKKFIDLQIYFDERLKRIEQEQNEKLNKIIKILENKKEKE